MTNSELEKEYQTIRPLCDLFADELARQLKELLSQEEKISSEFIFQQRIKNIGSIFQVIKSKSLIIKSVHDFDDLIGLRIILTFKREAGLVCQMIRNNLKVLVEKDTQAKLGESEFGYSSIHFIVEPPTAWQTMPSFKRIKGFRAEIQVRSGAQHIWASASRVLQYKQEQNVPPILRRAINRVSALLEMADLEFERVLTERTEYITQADTESTSEKLNIDLLAKILDKHLPKENKEDQESYDELLADLLHFSINTPSELVALLEKHLSAIVKNDKSIACEIDPLFLQSYKIDSRRHTKGVFFNHVGLARQAMYEEFGEKWVEYFPVLVERNIEKRKSEAKVANSEPN